jgi:hypothetical protein
MSDELKPCPMCGGAAKMHDMEEYFMAACECGVNYEGPNADDCTAGWNARTPPVSAPMGTNGEAIPLPPLPDEVFLCDPDVYGYTDIELRQAQQDAIAPFAERIRHLERELEQARAAFIGSENARKDAERARGAVQSIGDDSTFEDLAGDVYRAGSYNESIEKPMNALIAYIDGRTAGTAPDELVEIGNRMATTLEVLACALKNPGTAEGVRRTAEEWRAAAPTPLNGKEEA